MFSPYRLLAASYRLLFVTGLLTACEVTSLDLRSPGDTSDPDSFKADLVPGPIETPESIRLDDLLEMSVGVSNSGNRTAGPGWFIRVLLSDDAHIDPSDHLIEQFVTTRELAPGAQDLYLRNIKLSGVEPGDYFIGSILDVTDAVPELSDTNNTLTTPGRITLLTAATDQ
jgi:hypothetical protein